MIIGDTEGHVRGKGQYGGNGERSQLNRPLLTPYKYKHRYKPDRISYVQ